MRKYNAKSELDRAIKYSNIEIKDRHYYSKVDALWNEP